MSVKIRLKRIGRKKQPTYRIVVTESRNAVSGKVIDTIGHYNPYITGKTLVMDQSRLQEWRDKGAIPSDAVKRLIRKMRRMDSGTDTPVEKPVEEKPVEEPKAEEPQAVETKVESEASTEENTAAETEPAVDEPAENTEG